MSESSLTVAVRSRLAHPVKESLHQMRYGVASSSRPTRQRRISINQWYSDNLGAEATKGMKQKAITGGTISRAPLGYLSQRRINAAGVEVRYVELDPDRADLIRSAFELYTTGKWPTEALAGHLTARGLTTRATPGRPANALTAKTVGKILTNPYYRGIVTWQDAEYPGNHEAASTTRHGTRRRPCSPHGVTASTTASIPTS
ncbi:hypothetical protein HF995_11910 [Sanguibacter hominis ATCC BAA-789]|uniref:Recombinase domain-containing protein n=1 Tax=Sanguibacter hominis ATCC BAA-789 TaxID=1312740 RepID=A0A9X5ISB4_9MICO|nr:recombinase family protein [Sanguibacter hominis]NKX93964.1 hypothetical protein [Sanguibacter hominis ATCC BAA-789]